MDTGTLNAAIQVHDGDFQLSYDNAVFCRESGEVRVALGQWGKKASGGVGCCVVDWLQNHQGAFGDAER